MSTNPPLIKPLELDTFNDIRNSIEQRRHGVLQLILFYFICAVIFVIVTLLWDFFTQKGTDLEASVIFNLMLSISAFVIVSLGINKSYRNEIEFELFAEFVKNFNRQNNVKLHYGPQQGIAQHSFDSCGLFTESTEYASDGMIIGKIGETAFTCARVLAKKVLFTSLDEKYKTRITLFNGLFFIADANKNFKGITFVIPDKIESNFGHTGHSLQEFFVQHRFGHCELVSLEDPEFERNFAVYSSDQVESRYLLTPLLMQQISAIQRSWNCPIHIAFIYDKIFMAFDTPQNWFESSSVLTPVSVEVIQSEHQKILMRLMLVDGLGLNTRIWGRP